MFCTKMKSKIFCKGHLGYRIWVEVMMPALTALLANAPWQCNGNLGPVFGSVLSYELCQEFVFLFGPVGADHMVAIRELEEPLVALNFRFT